MANFLDPLRFVSIAVADWMNGLQSQLIDCLREQNRVLREELSEKRLRLPDDQRRRLTEPLPYPIWRAVGYERYTSL
jgi:hypothetical protein